MKNNLKSNEYIFGMQFLNLFTQYEIFDEMKNIIKDYVKDETALKALLECYDYKIGITYNEINKLEFNFGKDNYVCIEPKGFSIQLSTKTINGSIKELNDKWTELCKEKYVKEYEDNEFIPESYKYINW